MEMAQVAFKAVLRVKFAWFASLPAGIASVWMQNTITPISIKQILKSKGIGSNHLLREAQL
jgi:hypothetical protein